MRVSGGEQRDGIGLEVSGYLAVFDEAVLFHEWGDERGVDCAPVGVEFF